jgi:hypothetical protein
VATPADPAHGPARTHPHLLLFRVAAFALGTAVIVDAMTTSAAIAQWVAGLVLIGLVPPEAIAAYIRRHR